MTTVLHLIQILSVGGAARALIAIARESARLGRFQHRVISLLPGDPEAIALAKAAGLAVLQKPNRATILRELAAADIVHVNWWNNPELQSLLHSELPPMRLLLWYHVAGDGAPQIITPELVRFADLNVPTNPWTYRELPVFRELPASEREQRVAMVIDAADLGRVQGIRPRKHTHFNVGYIGSVDFVKMHRNFVPMSAAVRIPEARFIVCGHGIEQQLLDQARQLGAADRFDFRGYVSDIKPVLEVLDVYGYPLCADTYASGELNLQEIMCAGVPPVVFPHGGVKGLVENDRTGLVVQTEAEYREALEYLYHHPAERARLGQAAQKHAREHFGAENAARNLIPLYERLMRAPKRPRLWGCRSDQPLLDQPVSILDLVDTPDFAEGARLFVESLGDAGQDFLTSLTSLDLPSLWAAEETIARASTLLRSVSSGGILHYRDVFPTDAFLRLWSGLVLRQEGKLAEAIVEFGKAIDLGCDHWRVGWYIAQAARQAGEHALAEQAARAVLDRAPDFAPARELLPTESLPEKGSSAKSIHDLARDADAAFSQGQLVEAAASLRQAVALDPAAVDIRIALGGLLYQQGEYREAHEQLLNAARLQPSNAGVQVQLAATAVKLDRVPEFEAALERAFQLEPENRDGLRLLARLNFQQGRYADAARVFHRLLQQIPDDEEAILCLGRCFFEVGDLESAQLVFEELLNFKPDHALARENLAVVQQRRSGLPNQGQSMVLHDHVIPLTDPYPSVPPPEPPVRIGGPMILTRRPPPRISIVTPSFNQVAFLEQCLDSILSQNYPNLEYIVMDGGSSDGSIDIIRKYARHLTYWQSKSDGGQYHAIQAGFERSTGEIMAWLNSDDKLHPGALVFVAEIFRQRPDREWILGRPTAWNEAGLLKDVSPELPRWSRERYLGRQFKNGFIQQESTFWRRSLWDRAGRRLDTSLQYAADFELWARFFRLAPLQTVDALLGGFRYHSAQKTARLMGEYQAEVDQVLERETRLFEQSADRTLLPAPAPLDPATIDLGANRITAETFSYFTYSKRPHFAFFRDHDLELYGRRIDPDQCDLKVYQDLLVYTFIKDNVSPGSRILEVGGGDSRVLRALRASYECWNLDKLEGAGNGLTTVDASGYRLVKDYLGRFSPELPEAYFDFVFSISVFEHLDDSRINFRNVCLDLDRVMKPQALSLHCIDVVQAREVRANQVLPFLFENIRTAHRFIPLGQLKLDPHTFYLSEVAYNRGWKDITRKSYRDFGRPLSYQCLWQKTPETFSTDLRNDSTTPAAEPLVSVIVSAYAAEKYIRACLEDLVAQTIFDKLEIIVIDSGSPQNERAIVEEFQKRHPNIRYYRTERETLYAAWNRAIGLARGKYIANANCDDAHRPDAMEKLAAALEANPEADLAYGDYYTSSVPNDSFARPNILRHVVHPSYHPATVMMYCVTGCHPMWRKTVFDKLGPFDPTYTAPGDWEFLFRFVQAGLQAVHVPQPLSLFFQNPDGLSWKSAAQSKNENDRILGRYRSQMPIERLYAVDPSDAASVSRAWTALGNLAMQHEVPWFSNYVQDLAYGRVCYEQALKADPSNVAAGQNLVVARLLQQRSVGDLSFLEHFPAGIANALRQDIERGQLRLSSVEMRPAVLPVEFGERTAPREVPNEAVLPLASFSGAGFQPATGGILPQISGSRAGSPPDRLEACPTKLPVRLSASFLHHSGAASDALNLAAPLAARTDLATFDYCEPYSHSFDERLPEPLRLALRTTRTRFNFCLGGVGITFGGADDLKRVRDAAWHIARTSFAADRLPLEWVKTYNQMDELWVPSRFHAEVFAASGVERDKIIVIPGAVDAGVFDPARHEPLPLPNRAAFNFLAVFEWRARKGWDALLAGYLREFSASDNVCLYLRTSFPRLAESPSRAAIEQQIHEFTRTLKLGEKKLSRIELLTDEIPLTDLPRLYRAADCLVAPSRGESWGRVPLEAVMMGLPLIATNWGGHTQLLTRDTAYPLDYELVPATNLELDEWQYHGQRWANPSDQHLRELMRQVQQNPSEARAKGGKAREQARKQFSTDVVAELMIEQLQAIEERLTKPSCPPAKARSSANRQSATGPSSVAVAHQSQPVACDPLLLRRVDNRQSISVALEGSFLDFGSLSHVNRELSRQLAKQPGVSLSCVAKNIVPPELAHQSALVETARRLKYPAPKNAQVTIRHAWPPNWERPASGKWVLIQPWEFGVLPKDWVQRLEAVDEIWAPSEYVRRVYVESGVDPRKVHVVPNGIDPERFRPDAKPMALATRKTFKFLFVGGTIQRKGPDLLLKAYLENFTATDDVCLVIKDFGGQNVYAGQTFESQIRAAQSRPDAPEILYLSEDLAPEALPGLYAACDCLVHPYRGEGFGLPVLEAMACGLPLIVTGGGSTDDFATDEFAHRIPALRKSIGAKVSGMKLVRDGWLLEPDLPALVERMKNVVTNRDEARAQGRVASEHVRREWTWERSAEKAVQRLQELARQSEDKPSASPNRSAKPLALPPVARIGHLADARALFSDGELKAAWTATAAALEARPFHPEAFLLLAEIARAAGETRRSRELAEHARKLAPKWKPAQQFLKRGTPNCNSARSANHSRTNAESEFGAPKLPPWPDSSRLALRASRLSVCLITKNEERFLGQCLESIRGLASQIVVVDTGSTDWTRDIASRFGAEVYAFDWCDDFSAARNAALERATGDWVLFLDADEELLPDQREKLLKLLADDSAIAFRLPMIDKGREAEGVSHVPRLFRNAPGLFHIGRVHEQVFSSIEVRRLEWGLENRFGDATLLHHGYTKEMVTSRDKIARNLRLLQKALEELPGEPHLLMNLGLELVRSGKLSEGLDQYDGAFRALSALPREEVAPELRETLLTQFCTHLLSAKRPADVVRTLNSPLAKTDGLTATLHWLFGLACIELKNYADGAEHMRRCLAKRDQPALSPVNQNILKAGPSHCLALCLAALTQPAAAEKMFREAIEADPKSKSVSLDYARFLAGNGREVDAFKYLHQLVTADPSDPTLWLFGGQVALSKPEFLEFACDWTGEAARIFPAHAGIAEQSATAFLLSGRIDEALPLWRQLAGGPSPSHRAALLICEARLNLPINALAGEFAVRVGQEFVSWYRRLLAANAKKVVSVLNQRLEVLRPVVPFAVRMIEAAMAEADAMPVK